MKHVASCSCGQLLLTYDGEITRTSVCHCFNCQKRTGSVFGVQTRVASSKVSVKGESTVFKNAGDEGSIATFHFCPKCGATVYWENDSLPGETYIAIGAFTDPTLPTPAVMVYGNRMHHWVKMPDETKEFFG